MKISHGEQGILLLDDPHFFFDTLTLWTMSIATAVVTHPDMTALVTRVYVSTKGSCTTFSYRFQCPLLMSGGLRFVYLSIKLGDDI
jgi:hypothetical protein